MDEKRLHRASFRQWFAAAALALIMMIGAGAAQAAGSSPVQQEPTPSPTPGGQLQLPTATATAPGGPSPTPSRTPTVTPVMALVVGDPTNLRTGPGLTFDIVAELSPGVQLPIIGRWLGFDWLLVSYEDGPDGEAWVYAPLVTIQGDETTIPAVEPPAPPTANPTSEAAAATAIVLEQTPGALETATAQAFFEPTGVFTQTPQPGEAPGFLPTFTPAPDVAQLESLPSPEAVGQSSAGIPPAVIIISLGALGLLTLAVGMLRRLF